jgi:HK97 family phage portal protein
MAVAFTNPFKGLRLGRPRKEPKRDSALYPRLLNIGSQRRWGEKSVLKATPSNLRHFAKTVYARRAINAIKQPIATLPWEIVVKGDTKLNAELRRQIELVKACFDQPNRDDSFRSFVEQITEDLLTAGAGCFEHQLGGDEIRPLWMWPVDALSIQIYPDWDGDNAKPRYYQALGYGNAGGLNGKPLRNDELVYIKADPSTYSPFGLGALEVAFLSISRQLGVAEYAGNVASNAHPANLLFFPGLPAEDIDRIRAFWQNEVEGQGKIPIFGGGDDKSSANVQKLRESSDDALFLKYQELLIREIAASFGISPQNLAIERDVNRDTAEVAEDRDWRQVIIPTAHLIASYLNREVIQGRLGFSQIEFRFTGLDRDDEMASAKIYEIRYKNNVLTPNDERARLGLPPSDSPWADLHYADVQIAVDAARSSAEVLDPALEEKPTEKPTTQPKRSR